MKSLTETDLANALDETDLIDDFEDCRELARAAAQALGVPLAPEPKEGPAEEWPEWWGEAVEIGNRGGALVHQRHPLQVWALGSIPVFRPGSGMHEAILANRRALVAAYEAARKGCPCCGSEVLPK